MSNATVYIGYDDPWFDPADEAFEFDDNRPTLVNKLTHRFMSFLQLENR
ncbi:hypothetical protein JT358_06250 [Micrococcales bacterium 31B]|nr:hypothetical protein [Micrococcales bacterium 31B]